MRRCRKKYFIFTVANDNHQIYPRSRKFSLSLFFFLFLCQTNYRISFFILIKVQEIYAIFTRMIVYRYNIRYMVRLIINE